MDVNFLWDNSFKYTLSFWRHLFSPLTIFSAVQKLFNLMESHLPRLLLLLTLLGLLFPKSMFRPRLMRFSQLVFLHSSCGLRSYAYVCNLYCIIFGTMTGKSVSRADIYILLLHSIYQITQSSLTYENESNKESLKKVGSTATISNVSDSFLTLKGTKYFLSVFCIVSNSKCSYFKSYHWEKWKEPKEWDEISRGCFVRKWIEHIENI